jgi:hypothetical protein
MCCETPCITKNRCKSIFLRNGTCWETRAPALGCGLFLLGENYASGNYNVHRYATTVWAGVTTTFELVRTSGSFQPAILIVGEDGTTLSDGEVGQVSADLSAP